MVFLCACESLSIVQQLAEQGALGYLVRGKLLLPTAMATSGKILSTSYQRRSFVGRMSIGDFFEILRAVRFGIFTFWWSDFNLAAVTGAARGLEVFAKELHANDYTSCD